MPAPRNSRRNSQGWVKKQIPVNCVRHHLKNPKAVSELSIENPITSVAAPVAETQRLKLIDALRGVALLGILLMNIPGFSMPNYFSEAFRNDPTNVNFWVNAVINVFFEGKMRALFGMVFGAGVLLFLAKKEQLGKPMAGLFYRRMFWLVVFGLIHAHLVLWIGDILYLYGICGMLVYLFRNVKPIFLVMAVPLVAIADFTGGTLFYQNMRAARLNYVEATKTQEQHLTLTEAQTNALSNWRRMEKTMIPNREDVKENTRKMKSDYKTVAAHLRPLAWQWQTKYLVLDIWDSLALMLLGLALFKWGFLNGSWSRQDYWKVAWIGYGIGLPLVIYSFYYRYQHFPNLEANLRRMEEVRINWVNLIYPFQRILLVMAHVAALILLYKSNVMQGLFRRLEAVGQMAFTNYIMHSVICTLFFFGYGLNFYARLDFYQLFFVVAFIWILQLILSPIWLRAFYFGPLEWLWRSLTYWRIQPMRRV
jgi:uncharacterized protein